MNLINQAIECLAHYSQLYPHWTSGNKLYMAGWNNNGEWTCAICGTMIGKNLLGDKPIMLARQHAETCCHSDDWDDTFCTCHRIPFDLLDTGETCPYCEHIENATLNAINRVLNQHSNYQENLGQ